MISLKRFVFLKRNFFDGKALKDKVNDVHLLADEAWTARHVGKDVHSIKEMEIKEVLLLTENK
jgi:hypothetical protein